MKTIHPKLNWAAVAVAAISSAVLGGCSNQQTPFKNPFSASDRVPPPSTRMLPPGAAQPYYPGDPLPVMQSATAAPGPKIASSASPSGVAAPAAAATADTTTAISTPPPSANEPEKLAFSNERAVAIPTDDNSLRFELPAPPPQQPEPARPIVAATAPAPAAMQPTPLAANSTAAATAGVVPAAYMAASTNSQPVTNAAFAETASAPAATTPWRSPQVVPAAAPSPFAPQTTAAPIAAPPAFTYTPVAGQPAVAAPVVVTPMPGFAPQTTMDAQLRAVPSPPPQPVDSPTPRIRLPGYPAPQPTAANGAVSQPAAVAAPMLAYDPALGTLVVVGAQTAATAAPTFATPSSDGFRPRSSMR